MAIDPSLAVPQLDPSILRMDHTSPLDSHNSPAPRQLDPGHISPNPASSQPRATPASMGSLSPAQPSSSPRPDSLSPLPPDLDTHIPLHTPSQDIDPQILEALRSKDRIYVLKLGEIFETLIKDATRTRVELTPATSYQRLLVHRCSAYYKLTPETDMITKALFVSSSDLSRVPDRRICELVPAELSTQPAFKIMRRSVPDRRFKPQSLAGSVAGEDADLSDVEPSEAGSLGSRSNVTSSSAKKRMTIEEREAAYNEARSRIFMGFEEKEKGKDKDMSASSSSLSISGSTSTSAGGRSSLGDTDDASSPATESEWSTPSGSNSRDRKDGRRVGSASVSSSRSLRNGGSFHGNGSGSSSRNSRAASPSFTYANIYEPPPSGQLYDPSQPHHGSNMGFQPNHFPTYPYSPPGQGPSQPFSPPFPYYGNHYPYSSPPPMPPHNPVDLSAAGHESYPPSHQMNFVPPFGWPPHPSQPLQPPPPHAMHLPPPPQQNGLPPMVAAQPSPPHPGQYPPYGVNPMHTYNYPGPQPYYPPTQPSQPAAPVPAHPPQGTPQIHMPMNQIRPFTVPVPISGNPGVHPPLADNHFGIPNQQQANPSILNNNHINHNAGTRNIGNGFTPPSVGVSRPPSTRGGSVGHGPGMNNVHVNGGHAPVHGGKGRPQAPPAGRSAWSYGPGVSIGGFPTNGLGVGNNESIGPRFGSHRRPSGNNSSGGNSRSSSHGDDVSSIASSSTTSSSSRRTYTSTTSSQHPLPARPDWAVGMKAQPTLASNRHADSHSRGMSPISPPRSNSGGANSPRQPPNPNNVGAGLSALQATDFPPLSTGTVQEKKSLAAGGAWGPSRPVLSPTTNVNTLSGNVSPNTKVEDKPGDVYNPKLVRRPPPGTTHGTQGFRPKDVPGKPESASLAIQLASMNLAGETENGLSIQGGTTQNPVYSTPMNPAVPSVANTTP